MSLQSLVLILIVNVPVVAAQREQAAVFTPEQQADFETRILPILQTHCYKCHGEGERKGSLSLWSRTGLIQGGDLGPVVNWEHLDDSLFLRAISYSDELKMPPSGKLPQEKIDILKRWLEAGAPWSAAHDHPEQPVPEQAVVPAGASGWWAYQPLQRPSVPETSLINGHPIDVFLQVSLDRKQLVPNGPADPIALCRRVYYDLTGLPPTQTELEQFQQDHSPAAYERLIDRLLQSPHYGEKWGRHWLDVVRYAETNGYERDGPKPYAWRFRDYVIRSFNEDKPYDRFVREQLAGDELPGEDPNAIIATGFYRLGVWDDEPADPALARFDELDDYVATTGQVFLAMTLNCARCHDHKVDPISQADYYRWLAFFQDVPTYSDSRSVESRFNLTDITPLELRKTYEKELQDRHAEIESLQSQMHELEQSGIVKMPAEDQRASEGLDRQLVIDTKLQTYLSSDEWTRYEQLRTKQKELKSLPEPQRDMALSVNNCIVPPPDTNVMIRGNAHSPGAAVSPEFPSVLRFPAPEFVPLEAGAKTAGRRRVLADWIVSPENPLPARVLANRLWMHHFGQAIVGTPNDFGGLGELPTHPELLDWLACELRDGGWTLKRMHKLIMTSQAYQRSSLGQPELLKVDPANRLYWRYNMRRLTAEEMRDSILALSGSLNLQPGGPSVYPPIPAAVLAGQSVPGQGWHTSDPAQASRRSVYVHSKRSLLVPILATHDAADTDSSCPVRYSTTVPTQSLGLLNGEFSQEQARLLAARLEQTAAGNLTRQIELAIQWATARTPDDSEVQADCALIESLIQTGLSREQALQQFCLMCLNLNEFAYLD